MKKYFPCLLILLTLGVMINSPYPHVFLPPQQQRVGKKISAQNTYTIEDGKEFGKRGIGVKPRKVCEAIVKNGKISP